MVHGFFFAIVNRTCLLTSIIVLKKIGLRFFTLVKQTNKKFLRKKERKESYC